MFPSVSNSTFISDREIKMQTPRKRERERERLRTSDTVKTGRRH